MEIISIWNIMSNCISANYNDYNYLNLNESVFPFFHKLSTLIGDATIVWKRTWTWAALGKHGHKIVRCSSLSFSILFTVKTTRQELNTAGLGRASVTYIMACLAGRTHRLADDHMTTSLEAEPSGMMRDLFALSRSSCTGTGFPFRTIGHDSFATNAFSRKLLDHRFSAQNLLLYRVIFLPLREKLTCLWQCLLLPFYPSNSYHKPLEKTILCYSEVTPPTKCFILFSTVLLVRRE